MKRKVVALGLAAILSMSLSMTAFAASSTTSSNSSSAGSSTQESSSSSESSTPAVRPAAPAATTVERALPGGAVAPATVTVAVMDASGQVSAVSLDTVVKTTVTTIVASATTPGNAALAVQSLMSAPVSPLFIQTVEALATVKGSSMVINDMGTVKTAATAVDAFGNIIASAGVIKNVTPGALVMLMSVNADGTIEYVEGVVDPVTGVVMGAFQGTPAVITVLVLA